MFYVIACVVALALGTYIIVFDIMWPLVAALLGVHGAFAAMSQGLMMYGAIAFVVALWIATTFLGD